MSALSDPNNILRGFEEFSNDQKYGALQQLNVILTKNERVCKIELWLKLQEKLLNLITPDASTLNWPLSKTVYLLLHKRKTEGIDLKEQFLLSGCWHRLRILKWLLEDDLSWAQYMKPNQSDLERLTTQLLSLSTAALCEMLDLLLTFVDDVPEYFEVCTNWYAGLTGALLSILARTFSRDYEKLRCLKLLSVLVEAGYYLEDVWKGFLQTFGTIFSTKSRDLDMKRELNNTFHIFGLRLLIISMKSNQCFLNQHQVDLYMDNYRKCSSTGDLNELPGLLLRNFSMDDVALVAILILLLELLALLDKCEKTESWIRSLQNYSRYLCPVNIFNLFLKTNPADHELLLDWLVSNETRALEFLLKLIKYAKRNIATICNNDHLLFTLGNLRVKLASLQEKHMFPYNCTPLLKRIDALQKLHLEVLNAP